MPFVRRKRGQVLVVHNQRTADGKVQQVVLHCFSSSQELSLVLSAKEWSRWTQTMAWQHARYRWNWAQIKKRLTELLEEWDQKPSGAVARRQKKVNQLAVELDSRLRPLTLAGAADAVVIEGAQKPLLELQKTLDRLFESPKSKRSMQEVNMQTNQSSSSQEADELFDNGMEYWWEGDEVTACRWFRKALKICPEHADAHNHLGIYYMDRGQLKKAERHFLLAIEGGTKQVIQEAGLIIWGYIENRPYLRALSNLSLLRYHQGRYEEAIEINERLLRINPNDNQGIRMRLGESYHRLGQLDVAITAYEAAQEDPGCCYGLALALHENNDPRAGLALVRGFALNRYIASMLLGERWARIDGWHSSNMEEPEWAADYVERQGDLWRKAPESAEFLRHWWKARPVKQWLSELEKLMRELKGLKGGEKRSQVASKLSGLLSEGYLRLVAMEVAPEACGGQRPLKKPHVASLDEVMITREEGYARIEYADKSITTVELELDDAQNMTDQEILDVLNEVLKSREQLRQNMKYVAVEIPPGRPQIEYDLPSKTWISRGRVLRCKINDRDLEAPHVMIDDRELTLAEFGKLLLTYAGWGMRITFVPDDELTKEPLTEIKDPDEDDLPPALMHHPWIPGGAKGPLPSA